MTTPDYKQSYSTAFYEDVLKKIGAPVNERNLRALKAWAEAEGSDAKFNPFDTTQAAKGASDFNGIGVKNYTSLKQGVDATVATLDQDQRGYAKIRTALDKGTSAPKDVAAIGESAWGTSKSLLRELLSETGNVPKVKTKGVGGTSDIGLVAGTDIGATAGTANETPNKTSGGITGALDSIGSDFGDIGKAFSFVFSIRGAFVIVGIILGIIALAHLFDGGGVHVQVPIGPSQPAPAPEAKETIKAKAAKAAETSAAA